MSSRYIKDPLADRWFLLRAALIVAFAVTWALGWNALRRDGIPLFKDWSPQTLAVCDTVQGQKRLPFAELAESQRLFESGAALFLDARRPDEFAAGRLPGARNLPYDEFDDYFPALAAEAGRFPTIVAYCDGEKCYSSIYLARKLCQAGFADVRVFFGGYPEWTAAGLPVEK